MKNFFLIIIFFSAFDTNHAQDLQSQFYQAYLNTSLEMWKDGISKLEDQYKASKKDELLYDIALAAYGSVGTCFARQDDEAAEEMVEKADESLELFLKKHPEHADAIALMSGVTGFKIALSPIKGMFLGPKSDELIGKALKLNDKSAQVQYQKGSGLFYTPEMFGGNKEKAAEHLELARQYHENSLNANNWEYLNVLATLGQVYQSIKKYDKAKATYKLALATEPNFGWVKYQLLPSLEKGNKN